MRRLILLLLMAGAPPEASGTGTAAANFLKLGIGPRAIALGEAQVGLADDVYAAYWNPAGLAHLQVQEAGFVQNQYLEDISEQYLAYALPRPSLGTFAGSLTYLHVGKIQGYDAAGQPTGKVDSSDTSLSLSHARAYFADRRMGSGISVGMTGKYVRERLDTVSSGAYAGDLGVMFTPGKKWGEHLDGWKAGAVVRNLGSALKFDRDAFSLPGSVNAGLSYAGQWRGESYTLVLDGRQPKAGPRSFGGGIELRTLQFVIVRAGYTSEGDLGNGLRLGGGLRFKVVQVDYAYAGAGGFGAAHRIGLTLRFGKVPDNPQYAAQRWYDKGMRDYSGRRFTDALVEFNKALEIDPLHPDALKMMKQTYEEIKTMVPQ
ncbi:MAG: hypothetical protein A2992_02345 [Elusimicrobia bacterium RIFCSPLOWO2_01_FULL_59_12]|nr:MAG: hypothetical protein A2992_02345 [Elusimicrobia bacterium RIFCSPLOWO2_01_FULL_59_12]